MAFTSFNLSRFKSTFKRAMAALGYTTDSAIRARVLQEAQGSAVWARFAPSVAGYPALPRVAGNIQIDEAAALTALAGGVSDVLSYTAPVFKAGNTLPPLTSFYPSMWTDPPLSYGVYTADNDGGAMAAFATDWGYAFEFSRGVGVQDTSTWPGYNITADMTNPTSRDGCKLSIVNATPGRFAHIACLTGDVLNQWPTAVTEALISPKSTAWLRTASTNNRIMTAGFGFTDRGLTSGSADMYGDILRYGSRAQLKRYYANSDTAVGFPSRKADESVAAASANIISQINSYLTGGNKITIVRDGGEYQPGDYAGGAISSFVISSATNANPVEFTTASNHGWSTGDMIYFTGFTDSGWTDFQNTALGAVEITVTAVNKFTIPYSSSGYGSYTASTATAKEHRWYQDAESAEWLRVLANYASDDTGNNAYIDQMSESKAKQLATVYNAVKAIDSSITFVPYASGDTSEGIVGQSRSECQRARSVYGQIFPQYYSTITDYPSWEFYYTVPDYTTRVSGFLTFPETITNAAAQNIAEGLPLMYPFISAGWSAPDVDTPPNALSYDDHWMGCVKMMYMCGMVGADVGWYGTATEIVDSGEMIQEGAHECIRHWVVVGHVHATFSHLENYLRSGTLQQGDYDARSLGHSSHYASKNIYNQNVWDHPSYEYAHDDDDQRYSKVIVRKLDASNDWLILAWRCYDGVDKDINVTVAGHSLTLNARRGGTLYHMDNSGTLTMLDPLSMDPSRTIATILAGL